GNVRVGTISRKHRIWIAGADDQLVAGDRITVFTRPENAKALRSIFGGLASANKRVVIAGGGETGLHLARMLEREGYTVMVLESDESRCHTLASVLDSALVIHCDATHRVNLEEERVGNADVFVACTGDDEDNIMLCVEARDLGAQRIMAVIGRPDYASVMGKLGIDLAVSEREVTARQVLTYMTRGVEISRTKLPGGVVHVIELEVAPQSAATQATLRDLPLPPRCLVAAMIQDGYVRVPSGNDRFRPSDTAILLVEDDTIDAALAQFSA
ncbi:MAG TPA: NAD-binding protein, partial [Pirellulaceae bacterium]|nr:NAD-binding protein [Pirellulaceae bacterium]